MNRADIFTRVIDIVRPLARNDAALAEVSDTSVILEDLKVNSARLVDLVLSFEDEFEIEISDPEADAVRTIGDAVDLIAGKVG